MLLYSFLAVLMMAVGSVLWPWTELRLRVWGVTTTVISAGLAAYVGWQGWSTSSVFGPYDVWFIDGLSGWLLILVAILSVTTSLAAYRYLAHEFSEKLISLKDLRLYYGLTPLVLASVYVAVISNHVMVLWSALAVASLSTTLLVAFYRKRSALNAAWKYILLCCLGLFLALVGIVLTAQAAGQHGPESSLLLSTFRDLAIHGQVNQELMRWAFVFLFVGFGTLIGFVPLHAWLPDAYSKTPAPVSALLSGVVLNIAFVSVLRFKQIADLCLQDPGWTGKFFLVFGLLSIVVPAFILIVQKNYKRLLAYSNIEHMGLMAFAVGLGPAGLIPALMLLPVHALIKSALFLGAGELFRVYKTTEIAPITDAWSRLPKTALLFLALTLLLLAVPPSGVFASNLLMIGFGLRTALGPTLVVVAALSLVLAGVLKHVYGMLFGTTTQTPRLREPWNVTHVVMIVQLVFVVALGVLYLTPTGLDVMVKISQSLNTDLL